MPADLPIAGSCDCHVHVVGPVERYPQRTGRTYTAMPAALDSLRAAAEPLGVDRFVIVQPSFYGNDNQCLLETLDRLGERGRGVAAVDAEEASPGLLRGLGQRGVRGLRVNLYSESRDRSRQQPNEILEKTARILPDAGWHVEIVAPLKTLTAAAAVIERTEETFVIDHYGLPGESSPESDEGRRLLHLAALPRVWVKLSAPYRTGNDPMATAPLAGWLEALLRVAPDRCLWASDWPYTPAKQGPKGREHGGPVSPFGLPASSRRVLRGPAGPRSRGANPDRQPAPPLRLSIRTVTGARRAGRAKDSRATRSIHPTDMDLKADPNAINIGLSKSYIDGRFRGNSSKW